MARNVFYPSNDSYTVSYQGEPQAGVPVKLFSRQVGGTQVTDLVYVGYDGSTGAAVPNGILISDGYGLIPAFAGPDGGAAVLWGNHGAQGERIALYSIGSGGGGGGGLTATGGGTVTTTAGAAADAAFTGAFGPGSDQWLRTNAASFNFGFTGTPTYDAGTGYPTSGDFEWPDGTTGAFTGTIDGASNGYTGYTVTWVGATTKTVTVTGITYDASGNALGPTSLVVS